METIAEQARTSSFQERAYGWMVECFGDPAQLEPNERTHRFIEEAVELAQAAGCSAAEVRDVVDYVFSRPAGDVRLEAGGAITTLAMLCATRGVDMLQAGETELARIATMIDKIRAKRATKLKGSALPQPSERLFTIHRPDTPQGAEALLHIVARDAHEARAMVETVLAPVWRGAIVVFDGHVTSADVPARAFLPMARKWVDELRSPTPAAYRRRWDDVNEYVIRIEAWSGGLR